jgi:hypothetical protein
LIEAITCFDVPIENIRVLSLGTGDTLVSTTHRRNAGWAGWILPDRFAPLLVFSAAVKAQSDNALGQAGLLVGRPNLLRVAPCGEVALIDLDDVGRALRELPAAALTEAVTSGSRVAQTFLTQPADAFIKCPSVGGENVEANVLQAAVCPGPRLI